MATLYDRITEYNSDYCTLCGEWQATCPECGGSICVTCMDECPDCLTELF